MCRLYGFHSNEPTRLECSLIHSQNALMAQSIKDQEGLSHGHGWGVAAYPDGVPQVEKQAWAAWHGERFKKAAARTYAKTLIAHVRRATVGPPNIRNTHPFTHGPWLLAHNGTISNFEHIRPIMLENIDPLNRSEIHGSTDSEHIFRYFLSECNKGPRRDLMLILREVILQIITWTKNYSANRNPSLNLVITDGEHMLGSRLNRSLWFLERQGLFECDICKKSHIHHSSKNIYRAVEVASEPITGEDWLGIPNGSIFCIDPDLRMRIESLYLDESVLEKR